MLRQALSGTTPPAKGTATRIWQTTLPKKAKSLPRLNILQAQVVAWPSITVLEVAQSASIVPGGAAQFHRPVMRGKASVVQIRANEHTAC